MPNELSPAECLDRTVKKKKKTVIKDCTWTIAVHKGEKDGITNQHVHLLVNERLKSTMKKDRSMQRKEWLAETFRPLFQKEFAKERVKGLTYAWRNRLTVDCYTADKQRARKGIADHNKYSLGSANLTQSFDKLTVTQERDRLERNRLVRVERSEQSASNDKKETPSEFISQNVDTSSQESHQRQLALLAHRERLEKEEQRRLDEAEKLKAKAEEADKNAKKLDWIQKFRSGVNDSRAEKERLEKEEIHRAEAEKQKQALEQENKPKQETKQVEKQKPEITWKTKMTR